MCIPVGKVTTYGSIAIAIGKPKSARFVGYAMSKLPENSPWYRVVNRTGGAIPHWEIVQTDLLRKEGVKILDNGKVDIRNHFWMPKQIDFITDEGII
ncbi:MAG: cysteine methyltransferase [Clostridiales bacterium]|nr:cysteine methyltransferase [Clostridiales bacterium]